MNLDLVQSFLEIYRRGSLTAAAQARGLSQPAISGHLRRLEAQVGGPLFLRGPHGVTPTEPADRLARNIGTRLDEVAAALQGIEEADAGGTVRLGAAAEIIGTRLVPALAPLTGTGLRLEFVPGVPGHLLPELAEGGVDLVVSSVRPTLAGVEATPLIDEEFVLVAAPAMAALVEPESLAAEPLSALAPLPLVAYAEELPIIRRYWRSEFGRRPSNPVALVVPDLRAVLAAVVAGAGASVLPRYLAAPLLLSGQLVLVHQPELAPLNTLYLASRAGTPPSPAVARVAARLVELAGDWGDL